MKIQIIIFQFQLFCALFSSLLLAKTAKPKEAEIKEHFFLDRSGVLTIDGSKPGQSDPITVDMKAKPFSCNQKQYFTFTFCPDMALMKRRCIVTKGWWHIFIIFCYDPMLIEENVREHFVLPTWNLDMSNECGKEFRGFKVGLIKAFGEHGFWRYFYEIQTAYEKTPYYFEMPDKNCIKLWFGSGTDAATTVQDLEQEQLFPLQVRKKKTDSLVGVTNETYLTPWPDEQKMEYFASYPAPLKLLYLDFKSKEFVPQMMFTVGPKKKCNLFARVESNDVKSCQSKFKAKATSVRPFGNSTSFKLTLISGVDTNDTKGSKTKQTTILDKEFEEGSEEVTEDVQRDEGIQSYNEQVEPEQKEELESATKTTVEEKDVTSVEKKLAAAAINAASAIACGALSFFSGGFASCNNKVEFKDIETTKFHEAYSKQKLTNTKHTHSSSQQHSVQKVMQTAFTSSKGVTDTTSRSEMRSMGNMVSKRTVFQYSINIPKGKVLTPMQMSVDCDGSDVKIPWLKFRLVDEADDITEEYGDEYSPPKENDNSAKKDDSDYGLVKDLTEQGETAERAFNPPENVPSVNDAGDYDFPGVGPDGNENADADYKPKPAPKSDDDIDYAELAGVPHDPFVPFI